MAILIGPVIAAVVVTGMVVGVQRTATITSLLCATTGVLYVFADLEPSPLA